MTTRTRQMIEVEAKAEANEAILTRLRQAWKTAPVGTCDTKDHGDRVAVRARQVMGHWFHDCQACADYLDRAQARSQHEARRARSRAASAGAAAQTRHRQ